MESVRQIVSVLAVFALLGVLLWAARRGGFTRLSGIRRQARSLESIERLPLTPQHSLHLVRIQGREMVVATHPHGCALLMEAGKQ